MTCFPNTFRKSLPQLFISSLLCILAACASPNDNDHPIITSVDSTDFAASEQVDPQVEEEFKIELWAPGPLLHNAVALSFDHQGVAYVSETNRRKSSDIDIRQHRDWMTEELALESLEDTEAFHLEKLATDLSAENTWQEDFNGDSIHDWRDLTVQSENIRRIWDSDGDGLADASNLFASGFDGMLTGVAAGILHQGGDVYLAAAPDLWKLKDQDGDGDADERESISHGFGIHIAYAGHDMSGLVMGPDGKVYWSIGDIGVNVVDKDGKRWAYPHEGAVMRANPDGSEFEVFAHGLRNPQELAFDAFGNLISVDNDGDHPGERERFVHILEGSDTGWRIYWQFGKYNQPNESYKIWMDEGLYLPHFPGQAAYLLPALAQAPNGPAGLVYNPGTALGGRWNGNFIGSYFTGSAATSRIQSFRLRPKGASFEVIDQEDLVNGLVTTGLAFGPDGALYINDWGAGYDKKEEGRIWKLDVTQLPHPQRHETRLLLWEGVQKLPLDRLKDLLGHNDMRVRMEAQFELVNRKEFDLLLKEALYKTNVLGRLHAIWGLGQLLRKDPRKGDQLIPLLKDVEPEVVAQTAKVVGDAKIKIAAPNLLKLFQYPNNRVRYYAIETLGKIEESAAFKPMVAMLAAIEDSDPHLRHGITYALSKLNQETALAALTDHPSKFVRIGAVVALRHMRSKNVAAFLNDQDPWVVTEAARAIHDDISIPEALPDLAGSLDKTDIKEEAFVRRAINANLRIGGEASARHLANFANNPEVSLEMRKDALWALGYWPDPPVLDRVEGRYRQPKSLSVADAHSALGPVLDDLMKDQRVEIRLAAIETIGRIKYADKTDELFALVESKNVDKAIRKTALNALADLNSKLINEALGIVLDDVSLAPEIDIHGLLQKVELPPTLLTDMLGKVLVSASIPERQKALASLGLIKDKAAEELLNQWMDKLLDGDLEKALMLDLLTAIDNSSFEELKAKKDAFEKGRQGLSLIKQFEETLEGGDRRAGIDVFFRNEVAQCARCHKLRDRGGEVGPALTNVNNILSKEQLLEALIDPNARIAPGYGTILLEMKDGSKLLGIIQEETTERISLQQASGEIVHAQTADVVKRTDAPSGMPSMKDLLTKSEIRDVISFLSSLN